MSVKTSIIAGAAIRDYRWLAAQISADDRLICADSGLHHAHAIGRIPDIIVGDFDSVNHNLLNEYKDKSEIINLNDQSTTDLMKALSLTDPDNGDIAVYAACGQRPDHDFSNYLILLQLDYSNHIVLKTETDDRRIIRAPLTFQADIGDIVGVFPLLPIWTLSYKGLKYPAESLGGSFVLGWNGACNQAIEEEIHIYLDSGAALVTHTHKDSDT